MAELTTIKLNAESHLLLDQPLLRMPLELNRRTFKAAQRVVEREFTHVGKQMKQLVTSAKSSSPQDLVAVTETLDAMVSRLQELKRKLEMLHEEEERFQRQGRVRIEHLHTLYEIPSLTDVKYDEWSRKRLDRLLVDYMLRNGYHESAKMLAYEKGIEDLVDIDAFATCHRIEVALRNSRMTEALNWCVENKKELKKLNSNIELELRLQQYIEMVRVGTEGKLMEATLHGRKYFASQQDLQFTVRAAGLLAFGPRTMVEPYKTLYSPERWTFLSKLFVKTYNELYSIPSRPLLHIALSAGLSALKTPSCHSKYASSSSNAALGTTSVCPICSTELNELARNVPYAHHSKSSVENDPVVLPNGRIYGRERLMKINEKLGTSSWRVRDPIDLTQIFDEKDIRKVFIS